VRWSLTTVNAPHTSDLFANSPAADLAARAVSPQRELGAYEALWARQGAWFDSIADIFRKHPGSLPSEFVSDHDIETYSRLALAKIRAAGLEHFDLRVNGAADYPARLRDAVNPSKSYTSRVTGISCTLAVSR
jgi:DNA processing protein